MMSAQRDWHRPLCIRLSAQKLHPLRGRHGQRPFIPHTARPDGDLAYLPSRGRVLVLHKSSLCRANLARGLRIHLAGPRDSWRPSSALTSPARASTPSLSRCRDVCGDR